ncbi:WecB/TagA/CpsF family glycosyltransferase [Geodermatophilus nigrescens]|uniref:N-acetylglucosaminyldiphosphoundecaprenol N-acetyl-beta-D-mannosaminyltransferase n=1 Tax=Geodermatophilus nigrescens TaxID=1070870 RepID=A0A1M5E5V1_9ACTN|nr:WecB/TagA/CpsF family glycosyltransferase [Geodermatophilus nigrescens]SHF74452.1 N-acetylglucosaminyldiphosphoundecaprenol N-acetyl-beta-D-mannosaminyltransferase [Geodermatophilus nigrescens]
MTSVSIPTPRSDLDQSTEVLDAAIAATVRSCTVGGAGIAALTEAAVVEQMVAGWAHDEGGWIVTVNVDILRRVARDPDLARLVASATIAVADGMPLVWASRLAGDPLPERVTGASLVGTLAEAAALTGHSIYLLGGDPGVPEAAATALTERFPGTVVAGTDSPPYGFDRDEDQLAAVVDRVVAARPDLVLVGLGFPKQERLITLLRPLLPEAWLLGCGAGIPFAAGQFRRAPGLVQRMGAEWVHRLVLEPRRLARRYLVEDLPFALDLLTRAAALGFATRPAPVPRIPSARAPLSDGPEAVRR